MRHARHTPPGPDETVRRQVISGTVLGLLAVIFIPQLQDVALTVVVGGVLAIGGAVGL